MCYRQKLGYMALGAGIVVVGIIIGQVITPDIEAQSNGVFDKIVCNEISVMNKNGNEGIRLAADMEDRGGAIYIRSKTGATAIEIEAGKSTTLHPWHGMMIYNDIGLPNIIIASIGGLHGQYGGIQNDMRQWSLPREQMRKEKDAYLKSLRDSLEKRGIPK